MKVYSAGVGAVKELSAAADGEGDMPLLFMDTGYQPSSPSSPSAEECHSNAAGSEREGEEQQMGTRGKKRREKNRNAARKSRKKQTERADTLHEELQSLERSNSALQKEIATLKKDFHMYTTALERHEPHCTLKASIPRTSIPVSVSTCLTSSSPSQASSMTVSPTLSTSLNLQSLKKTKLSPTALASGSGSSADVFSNSSTSVTVPVSFGTQLHSLFSKEPEITSNVVHFHTSHVSNSTTPLLQSAQDSIHESPSGSRDSFLMKHPSFPTTSPNTGSSYSCLQEENTVVEGCLMNRTQPPPYHSSRNSSNPPCAFLPSRLPSPQSLSASPQSSSVPSFDLYNQPSPSSLLSMLTVPSPLNVSQTTSSNYDGFLSQFSSPLPPVGDHPKDLSLSEFLENNDWILSGSNNQ